MDHHNIPVEPPMADDYSLLCDIAAALRLQQRDLMRQLAKVITDDEWPSFSTVESYWQSLVRSQSQINKIQNARDRLAPKK